METFIDKNYKFAVLYKSVSYLKVNKFYVLAKDFESAYVLVTHKTLDEKDVTDDLVVGVYYPKVNFLLPTTSRLKHDMYIKHISSDIIEYFNSKYKVSQSANYI